MSGRGARLIKVTPTKEVRIKEEVISDDEATVSCCICSKSFFTEMALRNHAMMEHFEAFSTGDPTNWTHYRPPEPTAEEKKQRREEELKLIQENTERVISSMTSGKLTSLASEDVSYIIIKAGDPVLAKFPTKFPKKKTATSGAAKPEKSVKKQKEQVVVKGPFECTYEGSCRQIFFSCCEYSMHYRDEHTRRRSGLRCQVCEKPLTATDNSQFAYPCDVCGAGFDTNKELSEHTSLMHVKLKPFKCTICNKRFTQQGGVQQHMRMHSGDRPFSCCFCSKSFTQKSGRDQHLRIHTKVKPYSCVICQKAFCQSIHLRQHMRTHTNVSPFECGVCHKRFKQSSHLNYHVRNHDPSVLNADQLAKYNAFLGLINNKEKPVVEVEVPALTEAVMEETEIEQTVVEFDQDEMEQVVAEHSIQVEEGEEYVLEHEGETWSVQLVES